ncbi:hypothetical protein GUITHDRAFT_116122 [Guillardia theta CCMP2712]|uniref:Spindle pole body component n=1 Tax=Guillardia theta (strain CCMP2712) TaxID=905079 RepID=L1IPM5_GUITC|nr:hypothetical protein GUITHDRAFT_116122 [Guillardia theta CCMP2712]EKX37814.1 hypothetical protein GUITHDRAFT_116122 [Guillardia theta CCMP2712]|eukprot:XP_005824794.1 hypothetical protein GUITHDRAFT_116122 [Guillardia theta CCMP2712]
MVDRMVSLCQYYVRVVRFTELRQHYEFGLVNHALCAALQELLKEYLILVAQLEYQFAASKLNLQEFSFLIEKNTIITGLVQKFWYYVQPAMHTLRALYELVEAVESSSKNGKSASRGGALLNVLHAYANAASGEQYASKKSSVPYLEMLEKWIYQGVVQDPYSEFMVEERPNRPYYDDSYWEKRFLKREQHILSFLSDKEEELSKDVQHINKNKLDSMLSLSLVTSTANTDDYKDDLACQMMNCSALDEVLNVISIDGTDKGIKSKALEQTSILTGLETFALSYKVEWPLNIVFSRKTLTKYRWLFRHLFLYKTAERELNAAWVCHQGTKGFQVHHAFALDFSLRFRMLHFIQSLQHFLVNDVVENCWHSFKENMRQVKTVEDVLRIHDRFLDTCIKLFVLNDPHLLKLLTRSVATCTKFARYIKACCPPTFACADA